jgi:hypothetical protein
MRRAVRGEESRKRKQRQFWTPLFYLYHILYQNLTPPHGWHRPPHGGSAPRQLRQLQRPAVLLTAYTFSRLNFPSPLSNALEIRFPPYGANPTDCIIFIMRRRTSPAQSQSPTPRSLQPALRIQIHPREWTKPTSPGSLGLDIPYR